MDADKLLESLTWSDVSYTLDEFLDKFGVPNLVCIQEGLYGMNEASTFEEGQVLMLHALHTKHNLMGEDCVGRPIAIPFECENKLLLCPSSTYCRYDPIYVRQMSRVYPDMKYFRVLENHWNEGIVYLKPESILEIERIDSRNSAVKFRDVDQPLSLKCRVVFEPLLDYREYTLKSVVSLVGLPAKVRVLPNPNTIHDLDNEFENLVSNLGKITVMHSAKPETVIVATMIDSDSLDLAKTSVKCSQIRTDSGLNVCVANGLLNNDPRYVNIVGALNRAFLDKYDLKELDNLDKCQYLDQPNGNTKGILSSVLVAKVHEQNNNVPGLPPRNRCDVKIPPALPPKPTRHRGRSITLASCDQPSQKAETVVQYETCEDTNKTAEDLGKYDDVKPRGPGENGACHKDYHLYESISDSSSDDNYEDIDDYRYEGVDDHVTMTSHDYVDMTSQDHVTMASHNHVTITSEEHVTMTSEDDKYYEMRSFPQNKRNDSEDSAQSPLLESKSSNFTTNVTTKKIWQKVPFPVDLCVVRRKYNNKSSAETTMLEPNNENTDKAVGLIADHKNSQDVPNPTDLLAVCLKPDTNNVNPTEKMKLESDSKKPIPETKQRCTIPTRKTAVPIPRKQCALNAGETTSAAPIPTDLSSLSVEGVGRLLTSLNMTCYTSKFRDEQIDGEILIELDETVLNSLDLKPFHVRKLLKVITGWRPNVGNNNI